MVAVTPVDCQCLHGPANSLLQDSKQAPGQPAPGEMTVRPPGGYHGKIKRIVWRGSGETISTSTWAQPSPFSLVSASWKVGPFLLDSLQSLDCLSVLPLTWFLCDHPPCSPDKKTHVSSLVPRPLSHRVLW